MHNLNRILINAAICLGIACELSGCGEGKAMNPQLTDSIALDFSPAPTLDTTIQFKGPRNSYTIARTNTGITVIDNSGVEASVNASSAKKLIFSDMSIDLTIGALSKTITEAQLQSLIELYIAFFNRVPDAEGLSYWISQIKNGVSLAKIADSFYNAGLQFSAITGYSSTMSNPDFVKIIYKNVLGRTGSSAPTDTEVSYWSNLLDTGLQSKSSLINTMLVSARSFANDPTYGWVTTLLNNKLQMGRYVAVSQGITYLSNEDSINKSVAIASAVTPADTSKATTLLGITDKSFSLISEVPSEPLNVSSTVINGIVNLAFSTPMSDGGLSIGGYTAVCSNKSATVTQTSIQSPIIFSNLDGTSAYTCAIKATNAYGESAYSKSISVDLGTVAQAFVGNIVLGSPTDRSIKIKLLSANQQGTVSISYGQKSDLLNLQSAPMAMRVGVPLEFVLDQLQADSDYYYTVNFQSNSVGNFAASSTYRFHTSRASGSSFVFTIQADSHLDENANLPQYQRSLDNILADKPDFHIDLGDTFMTEKHTEPFNPVVQMAGTQAVVDTRYVFERQNFGRMTHSVPLYLVNGNHEGELGWLYQGNAQSLPIWVTLSRLKYYANPIPNSFYSGDTSPNSFTGLRASWYAWQWGDALFIALDPYWNSKDQASKDGWNMTLGSEQYQWLKNTLSNSKASFKFVFLHNLVGGLDGQMRGGIEAASFFEWGGKNLDGSYVFDQKRPGWGLPIHQLLVQNKVTAVFHGHDHLYVKQDLDGIVYQEVPQPSANNFSSSATLAKDYHYNSGTIVSSSGHIRVTVTPTGVTSQYVRSWLPANENSLRKNQQVDDTWTVSTIKK